MKRNQTIQILAYEDDHARYDLLAESIEQELLGVD
jgi:hypothetical protein